MGIFLVSPSQLKFSTLRVVTELATNLRQPQFLFKVRWQSGNKIFFNL